jgi:hypothetical protein
MDARERVARLQRPSACPTMPRSRHHVKEFFVESLWRNWLNIPAQFKTFVDVLFPRCKACWRQAFHWPRDSRRMP